MNPGLIETFLCVKSRAPFWPDHRRRLTRSAGAIGIPLQARAPALSQVASAVSHLPAEPHRARVVLMPSGAVHALYEPFESPLLTDSKPAGETLTAVRAPSNYPGMWAGHKTTARSSIDRLFKLARSAGAADAVMIRRAAPRKNFIVETTRANLFWIRAGVVYTPSASTGCLPGVARRWVIRQLRAWGVSVRRGMFPPDCLAGAESVFRTNALIGVSWVCRIADIGEWRRPHSIVTRLRRALRAVYSAAP